MILADNISLERVFHDLVVYDFWRRAVIGGLVIALLCSLLSVYVVLKRMAFIGQGISHSAFGGIALGVLLFSGTPGAEVKIYLTTLLFCVCVAFLIAATTRHSKVSDDSAIGIFFVFSMALGIIFFKAARGYNQDVFSFLFGSIVALTRFELVAMCVLAAVVIIPLLLMQKELLYYTFDEEMAAVSGIPVNFLHNLLLFFLALTIVVSVRLAGIVLVSAFLILPGATAQLLVSRFHWMVILSVITGVLTTFLGLFLSAATDWPTGATVVVVQFIAFMAVFLMRKIQGSLSV